MQIKNVVAAATYLPFALAETTTTRLTTTTLDLCLDHFNSSATFIGLSEASTFGIGIAPITTGSIWDKIHPATGTSPFQPNLCY